METEKELDDNSMDEEDNGDEEHCERELDVAGLARAFEKMSSTNDEGYYKDVLCIAISSLCGSYFDLYYY